MLQASRGSRVKSSLINRRSPNQQHRLNSTATSTTFDSDSLNQPAEPFLSTTLAEPPLSALDNAYVGFLKQDYGIDFGWGTSSIIKWVFEEVYVHSGLPLWASIMAIGVAVRVFMIRPTAASTDNAAKVRAMMPLIQPLRDQMKQATFSQDRILQQKLTTQLKQIYRDSDISSWKFALPLLNIPLGFGCWRTFRNMADAPVAGMETGGFGWVQDLTLPDPTYILPAGVALLQFLSVKVWASAI